MARFTLLSTLPRAARAASVFAALVMLPATAPVTTACAEETDDAGSDLDEYALDSHSRSTPPRGRVRCPEIEMVRYRGDVVRYSGALRVHPAFKARLRMFEEVVREVAIEVYGRAPRRIAHLGSYNCRRIRRYPEIISEHGLGNAVDIEGFDFGRAGKTSPLPAGLPSRLARSFKVRMLDHWNGKGKINKVHSRFLRTLSRRLIARTDIFRVLLGPAWPGHANHFHFDCANYRLVAIFED